MFNGRRLLLILFVVSLAGLPALGSDTYSEALRLYGKGEYEESGRLFTSLVEAGNRDPETLKSHYFLARVLMKRGRWEEASSTLIAIHKISPGFYREWSCDFLLGVCRRAQGKE